MFKKLFFVAVSACAGWFLVKKTGYSHLVRRNFQLFKLGVRSGGRFGLYKARRKFASVDSLESLDRDFQIRTAQDVTDQLGNMKGAMMKIGQMASYLDTGLNDNVRSTLASLQKDAPPMSAELVEQTIANELGAAPSELFLEWDSNPIAAASIGQVHKAITTDGRAVAVKVQYPEIEKAVGADLKNADWVFAGMAKIFPGLNPQPIVSEIKQRLLEELDYLVEAENQQYFHEYFSDHPYISVPAVHKEYSTKHVLTSDLVIGHSFDEATTWDQAERNLIAETLFRFSFGAIYQLHAFNGDPHPGNYLFNKGGQVTFLDFGLVKRFTKQESDLFQKLIQKMVLERNIVDFRALVENAGILAPGLPFTDTEVQEYFSFFYEYVLEDRELTIDEDYSSRGVAQLFDMSSPHAELMKSLNVPPSLVVLQRITLGLMGLFAELEATANWQRIAKELWPFVDAEPSTAMGRHIAEWELSTQQQSSV